MSDIKQAGGRRPGDAGDPGAGRAAASTATGWAALIAVWFLWGSTYDAIRVGVRDMPPLIFAGTRYLAAAAILLPFAARGSRPGERRFTRANWWGATVVGTLMLFGGNGLVSVGEQTIPAGIAALLVATVPLWLVVFDAIGRRTMIAPMVAAGLLLGLGGVSVLVHPTAAQRLSPAGVGIVLAASLSWAVGSLYSKKAPRPRQPFLATAMQMLAGGLVLFAAAAVSGEWARLDVSRLSWDTLAAIGWLAVPGSIVAFTAYIYALRALPTSTTSTYAYVNPIIAVLIGWPLLGERPTAQTVAAGVVIVAAVALILRSSARR
jgi:drug/metabolite transporter (DMT)-like permease